jgi:hypothetical protein
MMMHGPKTIPKNILSQTGSPMATLFEGLKWLMNCLHIEFNYHTSSQICDGWITWEICITSSFFHMKKRVMAILVNILAGAPQDTRMTIFRMKWTS